MVGSKGFRLTKLQWINVGGAVVMVVGSVIAIAQAMTPKPQTPTCDQRYPGGILFSLSRSNKGLQAEDLQARLGGHDWGLTTNSRIVADATAPGGFALEIAMKRSARGEDGTDRSGMGFTWMPRQLAVAKAACLSYSVWMPADIKLGEGGFLPGFLSEQPSAEPAEDTSQSPSDQPGTAGDAQPEAEKPKPFFSRPHWRGDGRIVINQSLNVGRSGVVLLDDKKGRIKPGHWTRIEEEVVLNTPGQSNGILRVWIDGQLVVERFDVGFRNNDMQAFQAISGDTHFARGTSWAPPPADTRVRLSALELRLR